MNTSPKTISHVRDILKKLDRSIDAARAKRLGQDEQEPEPASSVDPERNGSGEVVGDPPRQRARPIQRARPLDPSKRSF